MSHARDLSKLIGLVTEDVQIAASAVDSDTLVSSSLSGLESTTGFGTIGYATPSDLPVGAPAGSQGYVRSNNRFYISRDYQFR